MSFSKLLVDRNGFTSASNLKCKKQDLTTEFICLSNLRETSNWTPRYLTTDLRKEAKFPKSEGTWDSEFPNQITSVLI